ncbi:MAG: YdcF family protein [Actinomycetota bacterium]|nr:YdcF family protein [Actinomycetota bacterium]
MTATATRRGASSRPRTPRAQARSRRRRWTLFAVLSVLLAAILYLVVTFVQVWWAANQDAARPSDAIVVLGAAQYDGRPSPALRGRLDHAADLVDDGIADVVIVAGGKQEGDRTTEAKAGYDYLRARGYENVLIADRSTNTWENMLEVARILREQDLETAVLVSDPYHALRSRLTARSLGIDAVVSPTNASSSFDRLARETAAVAVGRMIGFRRL